MSAFEAMDIGRVDDLGRARFDGAEVAAFSAEFDPLTRPPTVSPLHICAAFMRLNVEFHRRQAAVGEASVFGPSPGVSDMIWHRPVQAGETLTYRQTVLDKRSAPRRPGWGIVTTRIEAHDEAGKLVFEMRARVYLRTD
ncbi:hypothetical protein [Aureimonas sp. D3]|uniref:hypothetical protein n=1 Tax=Aureimonas sp. D3 TaxID=1638164 RepID=UPI000783B2B5|nr:hypothetical protein [Aureimonas sp. D3]